MLSFSRVSNQSFSGAQCNPAAEMLRKRPSCTIQVNSKKPIPASPSRREQHMVSLMTEYACRWCVTMDPALPFGNEEAESTAFYAAIADMTLEQRRSFIGHCALACSNEAATEASLKLVASEYVLVDTCNQCKSASLHDWSADKFTKQCMTMASRPHVLVHYVHPCQCAGRQLLPLTTEEAAKYVRVVCDAGSLKNASETGSLQNAGSAGVDETKTVDPLFRELLLRVKSARQLSSPESIVEKIESQMAQRTHRAAQSKQFFENFSNATQIAESRNQCTQFLRRAQHLNKNASLDEDDAESDDQENEEDALSSIVSDADPSESSDTFSDEDDLDGDESQEDCSSSNSDEDEDAQSDQASVGEENESTDCAPEEEKEQVDAKETVDVPVELSEPTAEKEDKVDEVAAPEVKQMALRQTACELMIPICLPTDTLEQFEKLECNFVAQWAASDELTPAFSKIHLFRKQKITNAFYFGMVKTVESRFHLVATIAVI